MAFHLSVVLLGGIAKGRQGSLAKWGQRINDFSARLGRDAHKGNVGVHHYCFLLGQRVGEDGRRMLRGYPGWGLWAWPCLTQGTDGSHCNPLSYGESLRQKQEEKQMGLWGGAQDGGGGAGLLWSPFCWLHYWVIRALARRVRRIPSAGGQV